MFDLLLFTRETLSEFQNKIQRGTEIEKMKNLNSFMTWFEQETEDRYEQTMEFLDGSKETLTVFPKLNEATFWQDDMKFFKLCLRESIGKLKETYKTLYDRTFEEVEVANRAFEKVIERIPIDTWKNIMPNFKLFLKEEEPPSLDRSETLIRENMWRAEEKILNLIRYRALSGVAGLSLAQPMAEAVNLAGSVMSKIRTDGQVVQPDSKWLSKIDMQGLQGLQGLQDEFDKLAQNEKDSYNPFTYLSRYARDIDYGKDKMKEVTDTLATTKDGASEEDYSKFVEAQNAFAKAVNSTPKNGQIDRKYSTETAKIVKQELIALKKSTENVRKNMEKFKQFKQRYTINQLVGDMEHQRTVDDKAVKEMVETGPSNTKSLNLLKKKVNDETKREKERLNRIVNKSWGRKMASIEGNLHIPYTPDLRFESNRMLHIEAKNALDRLRMARLVRNSMKEGKKGRR